MNGLIGKTIKSVTDEQGCPLITFTDGTGLIIEIVPDAGDPDIQYIELQLFELTRKMLQIEQY